MPAGNDMKILKAARVVVRAMGVVRPTGWKNVEDSLHFGV